MQTYGHACRRSTDETFLQDFLVTPKQMLLNDFEILTKCFLVTDSKHVEHNKRLYRVIKTLDYTRLTYR